MATRPPKLTPEEENERELYAEEALARLLTVRRAAVEYAKRWSVKYRHAEKKLLKVRARWEKEALEVGREERRARVRQSVETVYRAAMTKARIAHNPDGTIARDANGQPMREPTPELRTAIRAMELIARMDGTLITVLQHDVGGMSGLLADGETKHETPDVPPIGKITPRTVG